MMEVSTSLESAPPAVASAAALVPPAAALEAATAEPTAAPSRCVAEGGWALLLFADGERRLVRVRAGCKTGVGKVQVAMDCMIGAPYGCTFLLTPGGLVRDERTAEEIAGSIDDAVDAKGDASNAELFDEGATSGAQALGEEDIRRLKQKGVHGAELVKTIAANSSTFAGKTAFAQHKYLRKKAKKHMVYLTLMRPSPLTLCDFYMIKSPEKTLSLRRDSLALLMTLSNAQPSSRVLVLDGCLGLVAAAAAQLLGGQGRVLVAAVGNRSATDCVGYLNLPPEWVAAMMRSCSLAELLSLPPLPTNLTPAEAREQAEAKAAEEMAASAVATAVEAERKAVEAAAPMEVSAEDGATKAPDAPAAAEGDEGGGGEAGSKGGGKDGAVRKNVGSLRGEALREEASNGFDCMMVAVKENPAPAILGLISRLNPSSPFVIYHQTIQPLAECMHICQQARVAVRLQLLETWTRKYQVAPNRTHPEMTTYPPTGYVLTGVTVVPPE